MSSLSRIRRIKLCLEGLESREAPAGLNLVSNWNGDGTNYGDLCVSGNYAYIGHVAGHFGVDIIDISDPAHPVAVANFKGNADGNLRDLDIKNNIGYFMSNNSVTGGVYVVDVHDPTHPFQLSFIPMSASGVTGQHSVAVSGNYLYETTGNSSLVPVFDISNPSAPKFVRNLVSPSGAFSHEVTVVNNRLYVGMMNNIGYTDIWDISQVGNTSVPVPLLTEFVSGPGTHTVWPSGDGNYVWVSHELDGGTASVFDIHNLAKPFLAGQVAPLPLSQAGSLQDVQVVGNLLYISWYQAGIYVFDISNPTNAVLIASYKTLFQPVNGINQGIWGVIGFYGPNEILASDVETGLYIASVPDISIAGQVFGDTNGNGKQETGETGLAGRSVYLDANNNGVLDAGERTTVTDTSGNYSFTSLPAGAYRVREVLAAGWAQTTTNPQPITASSSNFTSISFGAFQSSLGGNVFNDVNGSGSLVAGDPTLTAATIFLDTNHNGVLDTVTTTATSADTPVPIPDLGYASSTINISGQYATVAHVSVTLNITHTFDSDLIVELLGPQEQIVVLVNHQGGSSDNFVATTLDDGATGTIGSSSAPFTGTYRPEMPLSALVGANANGAWTLLVFDVAPNDSGTIQGWSLAITTTEPSTTSDANGNYSFAALPAGSYQVAAAFSGWQQTTPNPPPITISTSGLTAAGGTFGMFQLVTLSGQVFKDANGNGRPDLGETGQAGVTVFIDRNHNGFLDPGEASTVTDGQGNFVFTGRGPSTYTVRIVIPAGWSQTTANPADFKPLSGHNVSALNFGQYQLGTVLGTVFNDQNRNGKKGNGEPGLPGRTVFIDQNHDGLPDQATALLASTGTPTPIPDLASMTSNLLVSGIAGTLSNVSVTLNIAHTFDSDLIVSLISPMGTKVLLINRRGGSGQNFTNTTLSSQASVPISSVTAPFTGTYLPDQSLAALAGQVPDGVWVLQITDVSRNDVGTLQNWSLTLTTNEPTTPTDSNGNYTFGGLMPGSYSIVAIGQPGWVPTTSASVPVTIASSGAVASGVNFGERQGNSANALTASGAAPSTPLPEGEGRKMNSRPAVDREASRLDSLFAEAYWDQEAGELPYSDLISGHKNSIV